MVYIFDNFKKKLRYKIIPVSEIFLNILFFTAYNLVVSVFFISTEKTVSAHILPLLRGIVIIIPMAFIMSGLFGMTGIWLAFPMTELAAAIPGAVIYHFTQRTGTLLKKITF